MRAIFRPLFNLRTRITMTITAFVIGLTLVALLITRSIFEQVAAEDGQQQMVRSLQITQEFFAMREAYLAQQVALVGEVGAGRIVDGGPGTLKMLLRGIRQYYGDPALAESLHNTALAKAQEFVTILMDEEPPQVRAELVLLICDPNGRLLARTDRPQMHGMDLRHSPDVAQALAGSRYRGFLEDGGRLFQAATAPVTFPDEPLLGVVSARYRITPAVLRRLRNQTGADIGCFAGGRILAGTSSRLQDAAALVGGEPGSERSAGGQDAGTAPGGNTPGRQRERPAAKSGRRYTAIPPAGSGAAPSPAPPASDGGAPFPLPTAGSGAVSSPGPPADSGAPPSAGGPVIRSSRIDGRRYLISGVWMPLNGSGRAIWVIQRSLDDALSGVRRARNAYLLAGLIAMVLVSLAAYLVARGITEPLGWVTDAARSLEAGRWPDALPSSPRDEVGVLAGAFNRMVGSLQESQTRLRQSQAALVHSERLASMGQMAAGIAHEINNPLAAVKGYAQLLLMQRERLEPATAETLERILSSSERISRIVRGLLDFARRKEERAGADVLQPRDANQIVREALVLTEHTLSRFRGVEVATALAERLPPVLADSTEIQQVVINLLTNAADAMGEGGTIRLATRAAGSDVEIAVADTGPGIPDEVRARIFDPFFTTKEPGQGTGLGLAICHGIVERHRGKITVESREGEGTEFRVLLPAARPGSEGGGNGRTDPGRG